MSECRMYEGKIPDCEMYEDRMSYGNVSVDEYLKVRYLSVISEGGTYEVKRCLRLKICKREVR
jgi:hypothetical protein